MSTSTPPSIRARFQVHRPDFSLDVDLTLPGRGVTALFGPSGSGKTTMLRAIAGLEHPRGGFLCVNDDVWQDDARRIFRPTWQRAIGYVFQEASLFPHLDVRRNLVYGMNRVPGSERRVSLEQAIEMLGIGLLLDRRPDTLSGGERQRVAIARALAVSPKLLLMDEPLASLDGPRKREILPYLERLGRELEIPVVYVSHAPDEVARLADHLVALSEGKVTAHGPLPEILAHGDLPAKMVDELGVVLGAVVAERDPAWHLARADFPGGSLWVPDQGIPVGREVRIRVLPRDVSLTLERQSGTSILNLLPGVVREMSADLSLGQRLVRVRIGDSFLIARVTDRSAAALDLAPGKPIWVQIKSVAFLE